MRAFVALLALAVLGAQVAHAQRGCIKDRYGNVQCGPAGSHCLIDYLGVVACSPPDGGIVIDRHRVPVCGPGKCIADRNGKVFCSSASKGSAALNTYGDPVCSEGCMPASANACTVLAK